MENRLKQKTKLYSYEQKTDSLTRHESKRIQKLVAEPRRVLAGCLAVLLICCVIPLLVLCTKMGALGFTFASINVLFVFITALYVSLAIRKRPLYVVDMDGITDHGLLGRGFGLIKWRNIKSVQTYMDRNSVSLALKVDNLDELLDRRNALMRPLLWLNAKLSGDLGGEIMLSVTLAKVGHADLLEKISECSKENGRDVVVPPQSFGKQFISRGKVTLLLFLIIAIVGFFAFSFYVSLAPKLPMQLHILGGDWEHKTQVPTGKNSWIEDITVQNFGGAIKGVKIELSGSGLSSGFLKDPHVLLQCDNNNSPVHTTSRILLPLHQEQKNVWVGTSETAYFPHKDDDLVEAYKLFAPWERSVLKENIGWWSDTIGPSTKIQLFANVASKGNGNLKVKVIPLSSPTSAVNQTLDLDVTHESRINQPLYSVQPPRDYPVTLYPGGQVSWLSPVELNFDSAAKSAEIVEYYKSELQKKAWKVQYRYDGHGVLTAKKGHHQITINIQELSGHTPVSISCY